MIISYKKVEGETEPLTNFFEESKKRTTLNPQIFFSYDYKQINNFFFIRVENRLPPIYWLWIIFYIIFLIIQSKTFLFISFFFLLLKVFWSNLFFRFVIWLGIKKAGIKGVKHINLVDAVEGSHFEPK